MRCKCCNRPFTEYERLSKNKRTGDFEDMCVTCRGAAGLSYDPEGEPPVGGSRTIEVPLLDNLPDFKG